MLKVVTFLSFGLFFLILYYYYGKIKAGRFILKKTLIGKLARKVTPKEGSKDDVKLTEKINQSLCTLDTIDITALKILSILATIILSASVCFTNVSLNTNKIYNTPVSTAYGKTSIYNNPLLREKNVTLVKKNIGLKNISDDTVSLENTKKVLQEVGAVETTDINKIANITIKDILQIQKNYSLSKIMIYVLIAFSGMWLCDLSMHIYFYVRNNRITEESTKLMNILTIVLSTSVIPTNAIITMLIDNSKYLKDILQKFFIAYMVNSDEAYNLYLIKTGNRNFEKLIGMIKQIEESDQEEAIKNIRNQNENLKVLKRLDFENVMQKKDGIALIIITIGVLFLIKFIMDTAMLTMNSANAMKF